MTIRRVQQLELENFASTIREADSILVINNGELIERGTHLQLMEQRGFYWNLYTSQFKGQYAPQ